MIEQKSSYRRDCRFFSGYRPCNPQKKDCRECPDYETKGDRILIINLDSLGDVLRTTAVLPALKRKYPRSHVSWCTLPRAAVLLEGNPLVDRIIPVDAALPFVIDTLEFELALNVDKGLVSGAIINKVRAAEKMGFGVDEQGSIYPFNSEAEELYRIGLDDGYKFFENEKTENRLLAEAFGLDYQRDEYVFSFSEEEKTFLEETKEKLGLKEAPVIIGFNTGCSSLYPYKKLPLDSLARIAERLKKEKPDWPIILLGGEEDGRRNGELSRKLEGLVLQTPTGEGLRRGMIYTALADVVFTGDTLGLHMAVALKKKVVVWFGLTCHQEIELFGRGRKVLAGVDCRPCWKKSCPEPVKCYERVDIDEVSRLLVKEGEEREKEKKKGDG